jgi:hypothetical protein
VQAFVLPEEVELLIKALDKKIWSLDHVGLADTDERKMKYVALRRLMVQARYTGLG